MVIKEVFLKHYFRGFDSMVSGEILLPIRAASLRDEPIQHCNLLVIRKDPNGFVVNLVVQSQGETVKGIFHSKRELMICGSLWM